MKPRYVENLVTCPYCGQLDNVALAGTDEGVMWCSCGQVIRYEMDNGCVTEYKHITDFRHALD